MVSVPFDGVHRLMEQICKALANGRGDQLLAWGPVASNAELTRVVRVFAAFWQGDLRQARSRLDDWLDDPAKLALCDAFAVQCMLKRRFSTLVDLGTCLESLVDAGRLPLDSVEPLLGRLYHRGDATDKLLRLRQRYRDPWRETGFSLGTNYGVIGELSMQLALTVLQLGLDRQSAARVPVMVEGEPCNPVLVEYFKRWFDFVGGSEHRYPTISFGVIGDQRLAHTDMALAYHLGRHYAENGAPLLRLGEADRGEGIRQAAGLGLPEGAWYVCLHMRQDGYRQGVDDDISSHRNVDVATYLPAVRAITERGGWVVRMGSPRTTPLPTMERVIDYAHSDRRTPLLDVYLPATCRFFLATASGLFVVATLFGRPVALTNQTPLAQRSFSPQDLFLPKPLYHVGKDRVLPFEEALRGPLGHAKHIMDFQARGLQPQANTADEIRELAEEMMDELDGRPVTDPAIADIRRRFDQWAGHDFGFPVARLGASFIRRHAALFGP